MKAEKLLTDLIDAGEYGNYSKVSHEVWKETKEKQGWTYGPKRDNDKKQNPLMVPYEQLPADIQGQNRLTPYAVFNYFRTNYASKTLNDLENVIDTLIDGKDIKLMDSLGEYVHSHFIAAQLAKGETVKTRNDMIIYENLDANTKSWDTASSIEVVKYLKNIISSYKN